METISKIDNAYDAIAKINANFAELQMGSGDVIFEGTFTGNGDNAVTVYVDGPKPGDYLHIRFPNGNGNWATKSSRANYNKFYWGYLDSSDSRNSIADITRESWISPAYGFDLYIPDDITDFKKIYLSFRGVAGIKVPFIISRLSKTDMKPYFYAEMADTVRKIRAMQGDETLTLALCTDIHYRDIQEQHEPFAPFAMQGMGLCINELSRRVRLDNVVCLGDAIDGLWTAAKGKRDARDVARVFSGIKAPLLYSIGNHDDNRYYSEEGGDRSFTAEEIHSEFIQQVDERTIVGGPMQGCNYYRDIERLGIRLIVLMSIDFNKSYRFSTDTQTFLSETFSSMPEGYKAIIFTHTPLSGDHSYSGTSFPGGGEIINIIKSNLDKFIAIFYGHTHFDNQWVEPFIEINEGCSKVYNTADGTAGESAPEGAYFCERAAGDYRENLWDAIVVDKKNEILSCIRFGAGPDRYIHYAPIESTAGSSVTLEASAITPTSWEVRTSESSYVSVSEGVVTLSSSASSGVHYMVMAKDSDGNREIWSIAVE